MRRLLLLMTLFMSSAAFSVPLESFADFAPDNEIGNSRSTNAALMARGSGTDDFYMLEVDPTTGALITSGTTTPASTATGSNQSANSTTCSALTGSYATNTTLGFNARILYILNSCDSTIVVSIDSGTTAAFILEAGESVTVDLGANGRHIASGVTLRVKHNGALPTTGTVRLTAIGG